MSVELSQGTALQQGRYLIGPTLGEGGFGVTYRGEDTRLNRKVAIKELFVPGCLRDGENVNPPATYSSANWAKAIKSFLQEARTLAGLDYPDIVSVYDYFEQNNTAYMVMKFVAGIPLGLYVHQHGGTISEAEALHITQQVGHALAVVHANNLLHRDVKPNNIILTPTSQAVLVDFGAAREFSIDHSLLQTAVISAGFSPPEQFYALGRKGPYSDVFSLAATCYFMISGVIPGGEAQQQPSPRTFAALNHALAYNAADRPQSVADFLAELSGRKPIPDNIPLVLAGEPKLDDPARTTFGTPSFVPTYLAEAAVAATPLAAAHGVKGEVAMLSPEPALARQQVEDANDSAHHNGAAAGPALPVSPAAVSPSRVIASNATTHVVSKPPARRTNTNPAIAAKGNSGMHLLPVAAPPSGINRAMWLIVPVLLLTVIAAAVALNLSGNRAIPSGLLPLPSSTPILTPSPAPSPTQLASPTLLPAAVLSATNTTAPPTATLLPTSGAKSTPIAKPRRSPTPNPSPTKLVTPASQSAEPSPTHPSVVAPLPTKTPLLTSTPLPVSNANPTATLAPGQPTRPDDDPHRHVPPPPTNTPIVLPSDTPEPPSPTLPAPPQTEELPSLTPEPQPSDTPLPPPSNTPKPEPSDTPLPPPSDTPVPPPSDTPEPPSHPTATQANG